MNRETSMDDTQSRRCSRSFVGVLLMGLLLRVGIVALRFDQLSVDTDAYLAIAERCLASDGFCSVAGQPTAYRPPLFPLLVAISTGIGGTVGLAVLQVVLGLCTIAGTKWLAERVGLTERTELLAAGLVAVDPMLLLYSSQAMTEVLMTALTVAFFAALWTNWGSRSRETSDSVAVPPKSDDFGYGRGQQLGAGKSSALAGAAFGLLALCRPSIWPFAAMVLAVGLIQSIKQRRCVWRERVPFVLAALLVLLPWCARNAVVFGRPIITTTHGGYTALLGNNDSYYDAVASQPFGAVWSSEAFERWQQGVEAELDRRGIAKTDEIARDAAMMAMAREWIVQHPDRFALAAWSRLRNLWSPVPQQAGELPRAAVIAVGLGYVALAVMALIGGMSAAVDRRFRVLVLLLVLSLTGLHTVFWANARMRCPTHPLLAVLAAAAVDRRARTTR